MKTAFALVAFAPLMFTASLLAGCGPQQPMSAEDKALAVMLFARPSYTPPYQVPFYEMHTAAPTLTFRGY